MPRRCPDCNGAGEGPRGHGVCLACDGTGEAVDEVTYVGPDEDSAYDKWVDEQMEKGTWGKVKQ